MDIGLDISDILDALPFYVMLIDEQHHILKANRAVQAQLGLKPEDIIGKYCPEIVHGLSQPWYACPLEEAVRGAQAVEREALDEKSGRWIRSGIYPTGKLTPEGSRILFHMVSDINDRKEAEDQLQASREQLRSLSAHLESVREAERKKMAREIHDELGQILTALKIDLSSLAERSAEEQQSLHRKVESMDELVDMAMETVDRISMELRPPILDELGIGVALEWQAEDFARRTKIKCEFISKPKDIVLDPDRSTALFRIFQEALTNVARHSNASKVKAVLTKETDRIVLTIKDNGKGIEKKQIDDPKAFGIIGMKERAHFLGGEVRFNSAPGKGTSITVTIPLTKQENLDAQNIDC
ncbi:MAG: ATP-binding protein [Dehalococcoidia bacterium]|nr:ATP-binding protein [Dehalococcoidia bacterium]MDH4366778.1 ATP-binding protein [Dehalococcoidia bacterium]